MSLMTAILPSQYMYENNSSRFIISYTIIWGYLLCFKSVQFLFFNWIEFIDTWQQGETDILQLKYTIEDNKKYDLLWSQIAFISI